MHSVWVLYSWKYNYNYIFIIEKYYYGIYCYLEVTLHALVLESGHKESSGVRR